MTPTHEVNLDLLLQLDRETEPTLSFAQRWLIDEIKRAPRNADYRAWLIDIYCRIRAAESRWT
jgi:hypothetical protein